MSTAPRLLVISPAFHGYSEAVRRALVEIGHEVEVMHYDAFPTTGAKVRNKVMFELPGRLGSGAGERRLQQWTTRQVLAALDTTRADAVLIIRGDRLSLDVWAELDRRRLPTVLWLYDEMNRMHLDPEVLAMPRAVASYSPGDIAMLSARGITTLHLPNAFDIHTGAQPIASSDLVFIGARYRSRENLLVDLVELGVPVHAYGRDWSHHPYDRLRTWDLHRPSIPASRDISRTSAYSIMGGALGVINTHENQDGFTMRTFESCGMGGLQFIDRADVDEYYTPGVELEVFENAEHLSELSARAVADPAWRRTIGEAAMRRTMQEHTFEHRMRELVRLWD